jgi:hypothetical protein
MFWSLLPLPIWGVILFVLLAFTLLILRVDLRQGARADLPYAPKSHFYSNEERKFLAALMRAVGNEYLILGKVSIANIVQISKGLSLKTKMSAYQQIAGQQVDFILCDRRTSRILAVIALLDPSKPDPNAALIDSVFMSIQLPLLRFRKSEHYNVGDLHWSLTRSLSPTDKKAFAQNAMA